MPQFRSPEEVKRAQWAEKYMSVAEGKLYTANGNSPFPIHEYFKLGLLGNNIKMLEINAGHALVENMVADTLTDMSIQVGEQANSTEEKEIREFLESIDYAATLEEAERSFYGDGYGVQQIYRTVEGKENGFTIQTLDPSMWYPDDPGLIHLKVKSGRVISVFEEIKKDSKQWYALVEKHTFGKVEYRLYELENSEATEGSEVKLSTIPRFASLEDVSTDLDRLPIVQIDRVKPSGYIFGTSVLQPIWGILQEVSELQTQIRQERIKHFRSKLAAPRASLQRVDHNSNSSEPYNSKNPEPDDEEGAQYNLNQEVFPIPTGGAIPSYIKWDMDLIEKGSAEIDKLLSRAAAIVGCPKSVFNLDENAGNVKVDTERRKDRRYMRKIQQGQHRASQLVTQMIDLWRQWSKKGGDQPVKVTFANPFDLTQDEKVDLMKKMNPEATMVSQKRAVREVWPTMPPEEREAMEKEIEDERQLSEPPPNSILNGRPKIEL